MKASAPARPLPRYRNVTGKKTDGVVYTPERLADFVAGQIVSHYALPPERPRLKILDPAVGEGALLVSLLSKLRAKDVEDVDVYGFETNQTALVAALEMLQRLFPNARLHFSAENFLDHVGALTANRNSLFSAEPPPAFDLIIANPPYVRTQVLGAGIAQDIARQFGLAGRVDLYYAFILAMSWVLSENGIAGIIVSNRFMTTQSGASVRRAILDSLCVRHVWDLGDTKLFDAAVLPAVLLFEQRSGRNQGSAPRFTSIYECGDIPSANAEDPIDALLHTGTVSVRDGRHFRVQHGSLDPESPRGGVWRVANDTSDAWLATVKQHTWAAFADIGNIRVGIKTCADRIFIRSDWSALPEDQRPELLFPLTTHHIARRFKPYWEEHSTKVVYPHTVEDGRRAAVDLNLYPKTKAYFEAHYDILSSRNYVIQAGRRWYEIWVPQDPDAWAALKVVFRDISELPTFWMDKEGSVVNGDCYWLAARPTGQEDLLWLVLAVSNSTFAEAFYDRSFNNKLYAGRRRFMTQYVESFPIPRPDTSLARELIALSKKIYDLTPSQEASRLERQLDKLVWKAFGVSQGFSPTISGHPTEPAQVLVRRPETSASRSYS
jgi:hypothetical protein